MTDCGDGESEWDNVEGDGEDVVVESVLDRTELLPTLVAVAGIHEVSEPATTTYTCAKIGVGPRRCRSL